MELFFRALDPADADLAPGASVPLRPGLAWAGDPGVATGRFAAESLLLLVVADGEAPGDLDSALVVGERRMMHHLPSAVDIDIVVVALRSEAVDETDAQAAFSQAMMRTSLALAASGADGSLVPQEYSGPVTR